MSIVEILERVLMKNTKITTIELWRFILTVAIALGHLNTFVWLDTGENLIFTGGRVLAFFMFLSGYFLMAHYKKQKTSGKNKNVSAAKQTWEYTKSRFKALYPALFMGVLLAFIVRNAISGTKITEIFGVFMDSIWEFLGISQIGAVGLLELKSITFDPVLGVSYLWNGPLWYISALILAGLILYYIVSKSEDFFTGFFAPVFVIITYASVGLTDAGWDRTMVNSIGLPNGLARVMAGMCLGMLMYYVIDYFRKKKFSEVMTMAFSILHIGIAIFLLYTIYAGITWSEFTNGIILFVFCVVLLTNKDYIAVLYNKSSFCNFLGRLSLYYYAVHIVFVFLLAYLFPEMSYHASIIFNILFTTCMAFIVMCIDDYVVTPIFRKEKNLEKKRKMP